jgi:hypothetical protein
MRTKQSSWKDSEEADAKYRARRAEAQKLANEDGFDRLLTTNDFARDFLIHMLPQKANRYGRDLDGEVVMCENLSKCQKGHGPLA